MVRYADDMIFVFEREKDAERFYKSLPKRLDKYGLAMHEEKSQIIKSGKYQAEKASRKGEKLGSYNFLGFTCYWGKSRNGKFWRLKYTSRKDRYTAKLKELKKYLKENLASKDKPRILSTVIKVVQGWINYHAISDNQKRVSSFIYQCKHILFKWFNRMGGKIRLNWQRFFRILERTNFPVNWKVVSMF